MNKYFESIDFYIFNAIVKKLVSDVTTEGLIEYMDQFSGRYGITHETYKNICDMLVSGEIILVDSAWKKDPGPNNYFGYPKKPNFINVENYKITEELRKDKRNWESKWREYDEKYPVCGCFDNKIEFWMGEACSRNSWLYINKTFLTEIELGKFQFMLETPRNKESYSYDDYGQEYVFEFTGEDSQKKFVEYFRNKICTDMANKLMTKLHEKRVEEEANKAISNLFTLFEDDSKQTENFVKILKDN